MKVVGIDVIIVVWWAQPTTPNNASESSGKNGSGPKSEPLAALEPK